MDEPLPCNQVARGSPVLSGLAELTKYRDLREFLTAALGEAVATTGAQGGSLFFVGDQSVRRREGPSSPEIEAQISRWEDGLQDRLRRAAWYIREEEAPPVAKHMMEETGHLLVNTPLLHADKVTGCLTLVFAPGHALSMSQRQELPSIAGCVGNLAEMIEELTTAENRLEQLSFLYETSQALTSTLDLREVLDNTMELATRTLSASASSLMLVDEESGELVFEIPQGQNRELLRSYRMSVGEGIAGWVATHGMPAMVNDVYRDERFSRKADVRTGFLTRSVLCVPLQMKDRTIGVLEVLNKTSDEGFTDDDLRLLSTLAGQAAIAIENARLYRSLSEERDKIIRAQEEVRHKLARDLHDSTMQRLSSIAMRIDYIKRVFGNQPAVALRELDGLQEMADLAAREARTLLFELRPTILETQGLVRALETYVRQLQGEGPPSFEFNDGGVDERLASDVETTAFIIVQEAVNNARKHGKAANIRLSLAREEEHLRIVVEDDGQGFDLDAIRRSKGQTNHLGLISMQERAELIDAQFSIESAPGHGTRVVLSVPLQPSKG
jgi:signal transduction histidine kinase